MQKPPASKKPSPRHDEDQRAEKAALPPALRPLYAARHQQIVLGRILHEELTRQFDRLPTDADRLIAIDVSVVSFDERMRRAMRKIADALRLADVSLATWTDLIEFADLIQVTAAQGIRMLDEADTETLGSLAASSQSEMDADRRMIAEMVVILANFIANAVPRVQKAGYRYVQALEEVNSGVVFHRDVNSFRDIYPLARVG